MSAYWLYKVNKDVAREKCTEWYKNHYWVRDEYDEDYDMEMSVFEEIDCPIINGVRFEYILSDDVFVAFGRRWNYENLFEGHAFVESIWLY